MVKHPWTNGMVEAMNKKIKQNTSKKYYYENIEEFKKHLYFYLLNYNFNLKLKVLDYKTPWESIEEWYEKMPVIFHTKPSDLIVGLNILYISKRELETMLKNIDERIEQLQDEIDEYNHSTRITL